MLSLLQIVIKQEIFRMADIPVRHIITKTSLQSTVEHHILVLLVGAALGSFFTVQLMSHQSAQTQAAVQNALHAVPVAQAAPAPSKN
jgi:hypothetical protein